MMSGSVLCTWLLSATVARADGPGQLTVAVSSDLQDSGITSGLIAPMFQKFDPGVTLRFVSGTPQAAITAAESGSVSVLLTDAPALESQFVAQGFSGERWGRAVFFANTGSSIAAGPVSTPAGSYRAYAVNPAKFAGGGQLDVNDALTFLNFLTSSDFQSQLKTFVGATGTALFTGDATPTVTSSKFPTQVRAGTPVTVTGTVTSSVPGAPPLAGQTVLVQSASRLGGVCTDVAEGQTDASGAYKITFTPSSSQLYLVTTNELSQVEDPSLTPVFEDLLQPALGGYSNITVLGGAAPPATQAAIRVVSATGAGGRLVVTGSIASGAPGAIAPGASGSAVRGSGSVALLGSRTRGGPFSTLATARLRSGDVMFALSARPPHGTFFVEVRYLGPSRLTTVSKLVRVVVRAAADGETLTIKSVSARNGTVTVTGRIRPSPRHAGTLKVLGLDASSLTAGQPAGIPSAPARFTTVGSLRLRARQAKFVIHVQLRKGEHWILEPTYAPRGAVSDELYGPLRSVLVGG